MTGLKHWMRAAALFVVVLAFAGQAAAAEATPDDTAKFIAGLQPTDASPLTALTRDRSWQQYAKTFDAAWSTLDKRQLSKVRAWSTANLTQPQPVLYYMFSGPDFLYANAFFPNASTYVLSGLELIGQLPDATTLSPRSLPRELAGLRGSLNDIFSYSFFITSRMSRTLYGRKLTGTLPLLYVFLARSGKSIKNVNFVVLDKDGALHAADEQGVIPATKGVKIVFSGNDGREQILYYFKTDLSNKGGKDSGFLKFCEQLGTGDSLIKSASYLLHNNDFSNVRDFLLKQSVAIVQDDTGIPLRSFDTEEWDLRPFGHYVRPIPVFSRNYQPKLDDLFHRSHAAPLDFNIGYRWRRQGSSVLLAIKKQKAQNHAFFATPAETLR